MWVCGTKALPRPAMNRYSGSLFHHEADTPSPRELLYMYLLSDFAFCFNPVDDVRSCRFAVDFHMTSPAKGELCVFIPTCSLSDEILLRILGEDKLLPTSKPVVNMLRPACVLLQSRSGCKFYIPVPEMAAIISLCCLKLFMWKKSNHTFSRRSHFI